MVEKFFSIYIKSNDSFDLEGNGECHVLHNPLCNLFSLVRKNLCQI